MIRTDSLRHALRRLRARPTIVSLAVALLALGIGLATAMSTIADALVYRRLPYPEPEQIGQLSSSRSSGGGGWIAFKPAVIQAWRANRGFLAVEAAASIPAPRLTGPIRYTRVAYASPGLFAMLGVEPVKGRLFVAGEGRDGTDDIAVVSESFWAEVSGGGAFVPGTVVTVDTMKLRVVGLMPATFRFPAWNTMVWRAVDLAQPPAASVDRKLRTYVRYAPGLRRQHTLQIATRQARESDPSLANFTIGQGIPIGATSGSSQSGPDGVTQGTRGGPAAFYDNAVPILSVAVLLVFVVLAATVASLLLTRFSARRREYGMCTALGASRGRLLREALIESALLAMAGAVGGVAVAWALLAVARGYLPTALLEESFNVVDLDARALAVAVAGGISAAMIAGLLPAWVGTRIDPSAAMHGAGRGATDSRAGRVLLRGLLVAELAMSCALFTGAAWLLRSYVHMATLDRGLDVDHITTTWVELNEKTYPDAKARESIARNVESAARGLPGVDAVTLSFGVPPDPSISFGEWKGDVPGTAPYEGKAHHYGVRPAFFSVYRIPLLRGRTFASGDTEHDVIVGERMAKTLWPGVDPVDRFFTFDGERYRVVGVVGELTFPTLGTSWSTTNMKTKSVVDDLEYYKPFDLSESLLMVSFRCPATCPSVRLIQQSIQGLGAGISTMKAGPLAAEYDAEMGRPRAIALLGGLFGAISLVVVAGGLFGVLSYLIHQRRRELGIRSALGATASQIRGLVMREGALLTTAGLLLGGVAAWYGSRMLTALVFDVSPSDPTTWLAVAGVIGLTTTAASWLPARRAGQVDVAELVRSEE